MKSWYLTTPKPNITSKYESDEITNYAQDNFTDVLETLYSDTVLLYSYDLSSYKEAKCVIQGNTGDTYLKSMERTILFPIGTVKAGMYVFFENRFWLITGYPGNNKSYEKVTVCLCQHLLKWQLSTGEIRQRWINVSSASKYDVGMNTTQTITLTSNNYTVLMGTTNIDPDGDELEGKRVYIDKTNVPKKVFKFTRNDDVLYNYGEHGGILSFIADKNESYNEKDRPDLGICEYIEVQTDNTDDNTGGDSNNTDQSTENKTEVLSAVISGRNEIKIGISRSYTVSFTDESENTVDASSVNFSWNIVGDYEINQTVSDNKITLLIENEDYIDNSFILQIVIDEKVITEKEITIVDVI